MSEEQVPVRRARRSSSAIQQLVEEFVESGLGASEFCRRHGVVLNTLNRYLRKRREAGSAGAGCGPLVTVELTGAGPLPGQDTSSVLAVVVCSKRRIEVGKGFDAATLARLVTVLERL
jgi:transposase-like protein